MAVRGARGRFIVTPTRAAALVIAGVFVFVACDVATSSSAAAPAERGVPAEQAARGLLGAYQTDLAPAAPVPHDAPLLVGDSLSVGAAPFLPESWWVRPWPGLALHEAMALITGSSPRTARCVVVALGSNDVGHRRSEAQMRSSIEGVNRLLSGHPCVLWTTVKVHGVRTFPAASWARAAQRWNRLLAQYALGTVLDWNAVAASHPGYFLPDGLHMRRPGRMAYARFLRTGVQVSS
jgi:hypothetical protein